MTAILRSLTEIRLDQTDLESRGAWLCRNMTCPLRRGRNRTRLVMRGHNRTRLVGRGRNRARLLGCGRTR